MTQMTPSPSKPQRVSSPDWPANALPEHWMNSLFERMEAYYGAKFANAWAGTDRKSMKRVWAMELAGLTGEELRVGVMALKTLEWPPTLPEFMRVCRPPLNYDAALYEATQQLRLRAEGKDEWSNPAFYWAAIKIGDFDMLNLSHAILIKRFSAALDEVLRGKVEPVPARMVALPAPWKGRASPERVEVEMQKVRATQKQVGNKDWAHKIIERAKTEKGMSIAVLNMARAALGIEAEAA